MNKLLKILTIYYIKMPVVPANWIMSNSRSGYYRRNAAVRRGERGDIGEIAGNIMKYEVMDVEVIGRIKTIIMDVQANALRAVDFQRVLMYWNIGREIFEEEQRGSERAEYGTYLIKNLSVILQPDYGTIFSIRQLERCRQFYRMFPIASALRTQLSWTHNKLLISLDNCVATFLAFACANRIRVHTVDSSRVFARRKSKSSWRTAKSVRFST